MGGEHLIKNEGCGPLVDVVGPANIQERVEFICQRESCNGHPRYSGKNFAETSFKVPAHCRNVRRGRSCG